MSTNFSVYAGRGGSIVMMLVPTSLAKKIQEWGTENVHDTDLCPTERHDGRESSMHVTVQNGVLAENAEQIQSIVDGFGPLEASLGPVSLFQNPEKEYDVVKIDVSSDQLHQMNREIADKLEINDPFPEFNPHITVAYVKKGSGHRLVGDSFFQDEPVEFEKFVCSGGDVEEITGKLSKKDDKEDETSEIVNDFALVSAGMHDESMILAQDIEGYLLEQGKSVSELTEEDKKSIISQLKRSE